MELEYYLSSQPVSQLFSPEGSPVLAGSGRRGFIITSGVEEVTRGQKTIRKKRYLNFGSYFLLGSSS